MQLASKDIKDPAWKKLQGLIWRQGYADGVLSVPLYQDVAPVLKQWHEQEYTLVIFSSGSVEAQKLFFSYVDPDADLSSDVEESKGEPEVGEKRKVADRTVDEGEEALKRSKTGPDSTETTATKPGGVNTEDLNHLFVVNFDTINAGSKIIAPSYETIVKELGRSAEECLFLSDNVNGILMSLNLMHSRD
jgi:enolase-phosphatase E1